MAGAIYEMAGIIWAEMRADFDRALEARYAEAEAATNGYMVNRLGRAAGVTGYDLHTGPPRARLPLRLARAAGPLEHPPPPVPRAVRGRLAHVPRRLPRVRRRRRGGPHVAATTTTGARGTTPRPAWAPTRLDDCRPC